MNHSIVFFKIILYDFFFLQINKVHFFIEHDGLRVLTFSAAYLEVAEAGKVVEVTDEAIRGFQ